MKKIILTLVFLLLTSMGFGLDLGITAHYSPTAGEFVGAGDDWAYTHDSVSLGVYSKFKPEKELEILIKNRFIFVADKDKINIPVVGNTTLVTVTANDILTVNYKLSYYWPVDNLSSIYDLSPGISHKLMFDLNIPVFTGLMQ